VENIACKISSFNYTNVNSTADFSYLGNNAYNTTTTVTTNAGAHTVTSTKYTNSMGDMVGIALTGVMIGGAFNANGEDPFFPVSSSSGGDGADQCGAHVNAAG